MQQGDPKAAEELLPLVYEELRRLAAAKMVHEAWLRLAESPDQNWNGNAHFFGPAAEAMRRILVENARRKQARKQGGADERVEGLTAEGQPP
jgi:hypothetical protein